MTETADMPEDERATREMHKEAAEYPRDGDIFRFLGHAHRA